MEDELRDQTLWLESLGFKEVEIHYDLSCCQGSGASFSFENVNLAQLIDKYPNRDLANNLDGARLDGFEDTLNYLIEHGEEPSFYGKWNSLANHYTHEKTVTVDFDYSDCIAEYDETAIIVNEVISTNDFHTYIETIAKEIEQIYYDAAGEIYKNFEKQWEWLHSEEAVIENLKGNGDVEFTANGKCFKPDIFDYPEYTITNL